MNKVERLFFDEGVEMGIARGRVKGAAEGRAELIGCIRKKLKKGYAVIEIAEVRACSRPPDKSGILIKCYYMV